MSLSEGRTLTFLNVVNEIMRQIELFRFSGADCNVFGQDWQIIIAQIDVFETIRYILVVWKGFSVDRTDFIMTQVYLQQNERQCQFD